MAMIATFTSTEVENIQPGTTVKDANELVPKNRIFSTAIRTSAGAISSVIYFLQVLRSTAKEVMPGLQITLGMRYCNVRGAGGATQILFALNMSSVQLPCKTTTIWLTTAS